MDLLLKHLDNCLLQTSTKWCLHEISRIDCCLHIVPLICLFDFPQIFFDDSLLLHPLSALLLLSILVPKPVKEYIFNLPPRIVLSDDMQVLLGLIATHCLDIMD